MKLKYYLRGLGIGIVTTAFISSIANGIGDKSLTTEQIIQRAKELGMVTQEEYNTVSSDLTDVKNNLKDLQKQISDEKESIKQPESSTVEENKEDTSDNSKEKSVTVSDNATTTETFIEGSVSESITVTFHITKGMSSEAISNLLEEKGIIPDAYEFNQYVVDTGNVNNLQIGEFEVKSGESYDTIIAKLTKSE